MDAMETGVLGFARDAEGQAAFFEERGVLVYARLVRFAAELVQTDEATRDALVACWGERVFRAKYERPLLVCAAVHFDALQDRAHPLAAALTSAGGPDPSRVTRDAVAAALARPVARAALRDRFVQTNEVSRAIAWRLPASLVPEGARVVLVDLGCSAGLNLVGDALGLTWNDATGAPLDLPVPTIVARVGLDRRPIDPTDADAAGWLRACVWPGDTARRARLDAALAKAAAERAAGTLTIETADASTMPERLAAITRAYPDARVLAYQTVMADYLLSETHTAYASAMRAWVLGFAPRALWVELERAPKCAPGPAEIRAHVAADGEAGRTVRTVVLSPVEWHPTALSVDAAAIAELRAAWGPARAPA